MMRADERLIRSALADLTSDEPPVPAGWHAAIRRRAADRLRRRLVTAAAAVVLMAGVAVGVTHLPALRPQQRVVPSWALAWPDHRNGSVSLSVLEAAVLAWRYPEDWELLPALMSEYRLGELPHVTWYVAQTAASGQLVVVIFEVDHRLVAGWGSAALVMQGLGGCNYTAGFCPVSDPWTFTTVAAPRPSTHSLAIGFYAHSPELPAPEALNVNSPAFWDAFHRPYNPDNWMVILTAPDVVRVTWRAVTTAGPVAGEALASAGLIVADIGHVTAPVQLTGLLTRSGNALPAPRYVGVPGSSPATPFLALPASFPVSELLLLGSGEGSELDQAPLVQAIGLSTTVGHSARGTPEVTWQDPGSACCAAALWTISADCYGAGTLQVSVLGHFFGTIACDDRLHELRKQLPSIWQTLTIRVSAGTSTRWQLYATIAH